MDLSQLEALEVALRRQLRWPLPGVEAQRRLSPEPREGWDPGYVPEDARPAAGLVLLYPKAGKLHTVLTLRTTALTHHGGQLSLPGGRVEKGESLVETALREARVAWDASQPLPEADERALDERLQCAEAAVREAIAPRPGRAGRRP